jgi:REP-associated tyrosine transposase
MPRKARVVAVGMPHHVTQRGNDRRDVFFHHRDRSVYLNALFEHAERYRVDIWGYCLMTNHVHLIAVPESDTSLARTLGRTHADYARYANAVRRGCGHLWQARFYSCPMERAHCWQALSYIEQNPVRAGLAGKAAEYSYSSARAHVDEIYPEDIDRKGSLQMGEWRRSYSPQEWAGVLEANVSDEA